MSYKKLLARIKKTSLPRGKRVRGKGARKPECIRAVRRRPLGKID